MKKSIRKIASVVLASALCLSMGIASFAADPVTGTEENPAKAYLTKEFQMPEGTTTPTTTFTFNVNPVSVDGKAYDSTTGNMPANQDVTISYTSATTGAATEDGIKTYVNSTELFKDVTWPHAGVYVYNITEADGGLTQDTDESTTETLANSDAAYTATVYVKNGENGTYVSAISVVKTKDDKGTEVEPTQGTTDNKVDPSEPDPENPTDPSKGGALRFVNTYTKKINVTPVDPENPDPDKPGDTDTNDKALSVKKIVTGDLGDKTLGFTFNVKVTAPSIVSATEAYTAKVVNPGSAEAVATYTFTSGTDQTVTLKHGQELVFTDLYVGSAFEVQETDLDSNYTAKTYAVKNSGTPDEQTGAQKVTGKVSEGNDLVSVVNNRTDSTPAGILVNNLPFILMIAVAAAGFVAYIAVRRRRA